MGIHRVTVTKAVGRLKEIGLVNHFSKKTLEITRDFLGCAPFNEEADL